MQIHYALKAPPRWRGDPDLGKVALMHLTPRAGRRFARRQRGRARPAAGGADDLRRPADRARSSRAPAGQGDPLAATAGGAALHQGRRGRRDRSARRRPLDARRCARPTPTGSSGVLAAHIDELGRDQARAPRLFAGRPRGDEHQSRRRRSLWRRLARSTSSSSGARSSRASITAPHVPNVYHIGASTHPGPGLGGVSGFLLASSL